MLPLNQLPICWFSIFLWKKLLHLETNEKFSQVKKQFYNKTDLKCLFYNKTLKDHLKTDFAISFILPILIICNQKPEQNDLSSAIHWPFVINTNHIWIRNNELCSITKPSHTAWDETETEEKRIFWAKNVHNVVCISPYLNFNSNHCMSPFSFAMLYEICRRIRCSCVLRVCLHLYSLLFVHFLGFCV